MTCREKMLTADKAEPALLCVIPRACLPSSACEERSACSIRMLQEQLRINFTSYLLSHPGCRVGAPRTGQSEPHRSAFSPYSAPRASGTQVLRRSPFCSSASQMFKEALGRDVRWEIQFCFKYIDNVWSGCALSKHFVPFHNIWEVQSKILDSKCFILCQNSPKMKMNLYSRKRMISKIELNGSSTHFHSEINVWDELTTGKPVQILTCSGTLKTQSWKWAFSWLIGQEGGSAAPNAFILRMHWCH